MSMNTKSSPSRYRYCMSRLSTLATSTLMPALNVLSTTLPDSTFFSLVRTKAGPLPGLTCWNSTTFHSCPSRFSVMPFFRSFVLATRRLQLQDQQFPGGRSQESGPAVSRHDKHVLDPDATAIGQVNTRLDGDRNPIGQSTRSPVPQQRRLMDLQAHPVPETVLEMPGMPGRLDDLPGRRVDRPRLDSVGQCRDAGPLRRRHQVVDDALPVRDRADRHRPGHVRALALVQRAEVHRHQIAALQRPPAWRAVRYGAVRPARHDRVERRTLRAAHGHSVVEQGSHD